MSHRDVRVVGAAEARSADRRGIALSRARQALRRTSPEAERRLEGGDHALYSVHPTKPFVRATSTNHRWGVPYDSASTVGSTRLWFETPSPDGFRTTNANFQAPKQREHL